MASDQTIDNQQYYSEILRFLQGARTEEDVTSNKPWVKIHAVNYFVIHSLNLLKVNVTCNELFIIA